MSDVSAITKIDYGLQILVIDLDDVQGIEYSEREYIKVVYRNGLLSFLEYDQYEENEGNILKELYLDAYTRLKNYKDNQRELAQQQFYSVYG